VEGSRQPSYRRRLPIQHNEKPKHLNPKIVMMNIDHVRSRFIKHFDGKTGNIYFSPGRINLIGEHTDYNGGFVFPCAVDKGIMAEMRANGT
jgi:galactokinase